MDAERLNTGQCFPLPLRRQATAARDLSCRWVQIQCETQRPRPRRSPEKHWPSAAWSFLATFHVAYILEMESQLCTWYSATEQRKGWCDWPISWPKQWSATEHLLGFGCRRHTCLCHHIIYFAIPTKGVQRSFENKPARVHVYVASQKQRLPMLTHQQSGTHCLPNQSLQPLCRKVQPNQCDNPRLQCQAPKASATAPSLALQISMCSWLTWLILIVLT